MSAREHCYRCDKAAALCLCASIPRCDNRTPITIVQHHRERRHPFGTARIARLGLSRCVVVGAPLGAIERPVLEGLEIAEGAAVLFPDADAPALESLAPEQRPAHLVVIDGTWSQASQLRRRLPQLRDLPAVRLNPSAPSRYRVRREPSLEAISTLEAIVDSLRVLEPELTGLEGLLAAFDRMQDEHFELRDTHAYSPRHRHVQRPRKPLPEPLAGDGRDVLRLYAELHQPRGQRRRFPLRVLASRGAREQLLDVLVKSPMEPSCGRLRNMDLGDVDFTEAIERSELDRRLGALVRPGDTVVAWSQHAECLLEGLPVRPPFLSLKHYCANRVAGRLGTLDDVVERFGGGPPEPWGPGRGGWQIARLDRTLAWLRESSAAGASPRLA